MADVDRPITQVAIVSDPARCVPGFTLIDRTYDRKDDADLWRDGLFGRRVARYLCVEKMPPPPGGDVLVDVTVIGERDVIPAGFTCVDFTSDTREKAVKKKMLCVRYMSSDLTNDAICELILLGKGIRRPPNGYTLVGELNGMGLCYKMASFRKPGVQRDSHQGHANEASFHTQGYSTQSTPINMSSLGSSLPYNPNPYKKNGPLERGTSFTEAANALQGHQTITALQGLPFELNRKVFSDDLNITIPQIPYKTIMDIENQYKYDFSVERSAAARVP
ncbi:multivesicular body subunit 12B-like isoform X1 [Crassostrea virginica]|uniref:Multivesicular body subunit 12B-like isoform X1 n=1 Tax=Crassostrea virginica TaxID=6565 RepID=A0A8B8CT99_CRAVI|nr:multivesicular body subunit 12B-like isoform X1 [Crassostrea virginica]XP_022319078.1 multivesicular body subunit 12B-like isoform X1 [Crassostrea virginica]XP_022319079.1 multivesicular body subunit 12B-like isoform X1 [Crassostrea virginica]